MEHKKAYQIYKPRKENKGGASTWSLPTKNKNKEEDKRRNESMFLEMSQQIGEKEFDWKNKLIMKLGISDIGSLISVLEKRENETKLFHENSKGNSTLEFKKYLDKNKQDRGWILTMGIKREDKLTRVSHSITRAEGAILLILLRQAVLQIYDW